MMLKKLMWGLQWILLLVSAIAILVIITKGWNLGFDLSARGFDAFLSLIKPYQPLFAATFVVIAASVAIARLELMSENNRNAFNTSNRTIWMQTVREFLPEIKEENPYMAKEIMRLFMNLHDYLHPLNYSINSKQTLKIFFDTFFLARVKHFEDQNRRLQFMAVYQDKEFSFSFDHFRYIVESMLNIDSCYSGLRNDLKDLYQQQIKSVFADRFIDDYVFRKKLHEYRQSQRNSNLS